MQFSDQQHSIVQVNCSDKFENAHDAGLIIVSHFIYQTYKCTYLQMYLSY